MNPKLILSLIGLYCSFNHLSAIVYTTISDGEFTENIWTPSIPPTTLPFGDELILDHAVELNKNIEVYGKMTINNGASLIGDKKLEIGKGSTTGELLNNGIIDIKELKVEGDNSVENLTAPSATNNSTITCDDIKIGDDAGAGILINSVSGTITVNGDLDLDNVLSNSGVLIIADKLKNKGGTINGGGTITCCEVELDDNNSRPGTLLSQNICCDPNTSDEPEYKVDGSRFTTLALLVASNGLVGDKHMIDGVDFYSCGVNEQGSLPVELIDFKVIEDKEHNAFISWTTKSETNNKHFVIERSLNGRSFDVLGVIDGYGTTSDVQDYSFVDKAPLSLAYYRLKQVDNDGTYTFTDIITLEMKSFIADKVEAFPSITEEEVTLRFTTFDTRKSFLKIVSSFGKVMHEEAVYTSNTLEYRILDLTKYEPGHYNVMISDGHKFMTTHFVVIKRY